MKQNNNKQKLEAQKLQTPGYNSELWPTLKKPEFLVKWLKSDVLVCNCALKSTNWQENWSFWFMDAFVCPFPNGVVMLVGTKPCPVTHNPPNTPSSSLPPSLPPSSSSSSPCLALTPQLFSRLLGGRCGVRERGRRGDDNEGSMHRLLLRAFCAAMFVSVRTPPCNMDATFTADHVLQTSS